jgi:hypothetical protein
MLSSLYPRAGGLSLRNIATAWIRLSTNIRARAFKVTPFNKTGRHKNMKSAAQTKLAFYPNLQRERGNIILVLYYEN